MSSGNNLPYDSSKYYGFSQTTKRDQIFCTVYVDFYEPKSQKCRVFWEEEKFVLTGFQGVAQ